MIAYSVSTILRFVDFIDTFFFVARKKFSHVSTLQVIKIVVVTFNLDKKNA